MPRPSKTKAREEALERRQAARADCAQAFAGILSQRDLRPIVLALADWQQAAEALNEEGQTVCDEASAYVDERSDTWQESDKG
jgi:hypothetical protein